MSHPRGALSLASTSILLGFLILVPATELAAAPGTIQCLDGSPATPVPEFGPGSERLWPDGFQPAQPPGQPLPTIRDSTQWNGFSRPDASSGLEFFNAVDILEDGSRDYLYMVYNSGFQIWDITGSFAANPDRVSFRDGFQGAFFEFQSTPTEFYFLLWDIDAIDPPGNPGDTLVAVAASEPVGFSIWDATEKSSPDQLYQDTGMGSHQTSAVNINGRSYAFVGSADGIHVYDLMRAREVGTCVDDTSAPGSLCGGSNPIYRGRLDPWPWGRVQYLDVLAVPTSGGTKYYVASSDEFLFNDLGVEIREIINPASATSSAVLEGLNTLSHGVDLFEHDDRYYLATINFDHIEVYDLTSCLQNSTSCNFNSRKLRQETLFAESFAYVQVSKSGGRPFLYQGYHTLCSEPPSTSEPSFEYLLDLSDIASGQVEDIRGDSYLDPNHSSPQRRIDYWSSYYDQSTGGFTVFAGRHGMFHGDYFYRAALSMFDVHEVTSVTPTLTINGPAEGFLGDPQAFQANAGGCSPSATYNWNASGGGQVQGTGANVNITWPQGAGAGNKTVTVTNSGCSGAQGTATILMQDGAAMVDGVSITPAAPLVCQTVTAGAVGADGRPPLTFAWEIRDGIGSVVASQSGPSDNIVWATDASTPPGNYTAEVTVSNPDNPSGEAASAPFTLSTPAALDFVSGPTYDGAPADPPGGTVQFRAQTVGASEWTWDFDDGTIETFHTQTAGENPQHTYEAIGPYQVTLTISNCIEPEGLTGDPLTVNIVEIAQLEVLQFQAICSFGVCEFETGQSVTFQQQFEGDPETYKYDWDGSGGFEDSSPTPVTSHVYTTPASDFFPRVQISRGGDTASFTHVEALTVFAGGGGSDPSINITGPASRQTNQAGNFTATASDCNPSANGWSWNPGGGNFTGSSTGNQVTITWSTPGTKIITASNSACNPAQDSHTIVVTEPGGGGGGGELDAEFTFSPANPSAGQSVSFDGSGSVGDIGTYEWDFGDGSTDTGEQVSHAFASGDSYTVKLTVGEVGCASPACFDSQTETVVVSGGGGGGGGGGTGPSGPLLLPYFTVDIDDPAGPTTLFAVRNGSDSDITVRYDYFGAAGPNPQTEIFNLGPRAVRTVNMRSIYETTDLATGHAQMTVVDPGSLAPTDNQEVLSGDFFLIDLSNNFASGSRMLRASAPDLCSSWNVRFFNGGAFDGGTDFAFYAPGNTGGVIPVVTGDVYDEEGNQVTTIELFSSDVSFEESSLELPLGVDFGAIEWRFREGVEGHVSALFKASNKFSVGLPAICQDTVAEAPLAEQMLVLPHYLIDADNASGLTTLFAVRNASDSELEVRYEYFGEGSETAAATQFFLLGAQEVRTVNLRDITLPVNQETGLATGSVRMTIVDPETMLPTPAGPVLSGDAFRLDPSNDFASGSPLLTRAPLGDDLCQSWSGRFFNGGAFDGGTEFNFYVPSELAEGAPRVSGLVYDEAGSFVQEISLQSQEFSFSVSSLDLGLQTSFGAIEWRFADGAVGHVSAVFKASGKFSVGMPAVCQDAPATEE